jgi:hypothetical protein
MGPSTVRPHEEENTAYEDKWLWERRLEVATQLSHTSDLPAVFVLAAIHDY